MKFLGEIKDFKRKAGVYKITCLKNNLFYIGSSWNLYKRYKEHTNDLKKNRHTNDHLGNSWNKYGEANFLFEIIEECEINNILEREQYYLDTLFPWKRGVGFNHSPTAKSILGFKKSKESVELSRKILIERYGKTFEIISPSGEKFVVKGYSDFAKIHNISKQSLCQLFKKEIRYTNGGWKLPDVEQHKDYTLTDPDNKKILIKRGKLVQFCKKMDLNYNSIRLVCCERKESYKGWKK